ncbi:MAG: hypothetical protein CME93_09055 [Hyphomonadaceae bacterium]|nr:hypothetical protein [Hyphomonadaceae bacterium]
MSHLEKAGVRALNGRLSCWRVKNGKRHTVTQLQPTIVTARHSATRHYGQRPDLTRYLLVRFAVNISTATVNTAASPQPAAPERQAKWQAATRIYISGLSHSIVAKLKR